MMSIIYFLRMLGITHEITLQTDNETEGKVDTLFQPTTWWEVNTMLRNRHSPVAE